MTGLVIIDGCGANLTSLSNALARLNVQATLSHKPEIIRNAQRVILPGVGAAGEVMARLSDKGLVDLIPTLTQPTLGICVGMQVLLDSSEEDDTKCLGIVPGRLQKLPASSAHPVPHMGWNTVTSEHELFRHLSSPGYNYFVHSYAAPLGPYTIATTDYSTTFSAAVQKENFIGLQFHPERSGNVGSSILKRFIEWQPVC